VKKQNRKFSTSVQLESNKLQKSNARRMCLVKAYN